MAATSCRQCVFSVWNDNKQIDCELDRVHKLPNLLVTDNDKLHYVLIQNICTGFRPPEWLKLSDDLPIGRAKKELFPRVQLFIIIDNDQQKWKVLDNPDLDRYYSIDILYTNVLTPDIKDSRHSQDFLTANRHLLRRENTHIHYCYARVEDHINQLVNPKGMFYVIVSNHDYDLPEGFLDKVDRRINEDLKPLMGILGKPCYDGCVIPTVMHKLFHGFGEQSMPEKITIDSENRDYTANVFTTIEGFMNG